MSDRALEILHQMASDMNKWNRQLFPNLVITARNHVVIVWQVKSCNKISAVGSLRPTHGKITILPVDHGIPGPGRGSLKAIRSQSGRHPDQVHFYGSMANVSFRPEFTLSQRPIVFSFLAGAGKSVLWYVSLSIFMYFF
jgi:hypothetical protein